MIQHAYERCPDCADALRGSAVARRREVIERPLMPAEVVEHQVLIPIGARRSGAQEAV